jgi:hypothetical protein
MQTKVYIKENSWMASIAAFKLSTKSVAMVIGKTVHLYNVSKKDFLLNDAWVCHELTHIKQFEENGLIGFLCKYLWESIKTGYHNNKYEIEARMNEGNQDLKQKYIIV